MNIKVVNTSDFPATMSNITVKLLSFSTVQTATGPPEN